MNKPIKKSRQHYRDEEHTAEPANATEDSDEPKAPAESGRLYRSALLEPIETEERGEDDLFILRDGLVSSLRADPLPELASVQSVLCEIDSREVPTPALLEVVTLSVLNDRPVQYRLLAEGDIYKRGEIVERELGRLRHLLVRAREQYDPEAPNGVTWN